jgi:molybdopterin synthase catalytic subunit
MDFKITSVVIDPVARKADLEAAAAGACVTFEGWVRNHNEGAAVQALEYEAHQSIAEKESSPRRAHASRSTRPTASIASASSQSATARCGSV